MNNNVSKLGISYTLLGALCYFVAMVGGIIPLALLVGYILVCEKDGYVRGTAIKATLTYLLFCVLSIAFRLIPDFFGALEDLVEIFDSWASLNDFFMFFSQLSVFIATAFSFAKDLFLLLLGISALKRKSFMVPFVDKFISNHVLVESAGEENIDIF